MNFSRCFTRIAALVLVTASLGAGCGGDNNTVNRSTSTGLEP